MAYLTQTVNNTGSFVTTTNIWDAQAIEQVDVTSPEFKSLLVALYFDVNTIATVLNNKVSGYLVDQEFVSGKLYANPTSANPNDLIPGFTKSFIFTGPIGAGITSINHGITVDANLRWISIIGAATDNIGFGGYPITYGDPSGNNIGVTTSATQIIIDNGSGVNFSSAYVTVEYVKY